MRKAVDDILSKYALSGLCTLFSIVGYLANDRLVKIDAALEKLDQKISARDEKHVNGDSGFAQRLARLETYIENLIRNGCDKNCN